LLEKLLYLSEVDRRKIHKNNPPAGGATWEIIMQENNNNAPSRSTADELVAGITSGLELSKIKK
jgi:hypothetical protein